MKKNILIDYTTRLVRIAVLEEDTLKYLYLEDPLCQGAQDDIVQGQITDIVKSLKAAFVDFGSDKKGFLHLADIPEIYSGHLHQGLRLPVQVVKESTGEKGHKLTGFINISGEYVVCLPFEKGIGLSKKIKNPETRERIKTYLTQKTNGEYGFIVRTKAQDISLELLEKDVDEVLQKTKQLLKMKDAVSKGTRLVEPKLFYHHIVQEHTSIKDHVQISCNEETYLEKLKIEFSNSSNINYQLYPPQQNVFKSYNIEKDYQEILKNKVWLKNGGNLMIQYTEAMTVIDVNSGKAIEKKNRTKAIWELNTLALTEAVKQMKWRNLAGIIILDLVDFLDSSQKQAFNTFATEFIAQNDASRSVVYPLTELHLLQIARRKQYTPLYQKVYKDCSYCNAPYSQYNMSYSAYLIEQQLKGVKTNTTHQLVYVQCEPDLFEYLARSEFAEACYERYKINLKLIKEMHQKHFKMSYHIEDSIED